MSAGSLRIFRYRLPITDAPALHLRFVGTVPVFGGSLIFHVFEVAR